MVNITTGENVVQETAGKNSPSSTEGKLKHSRKATRNVTPATALELLTSALAHCQESGINIHMAHYNNQLILVFPAGYDVSTTAAGSEIKEVKP